MLLLILIAVISCDSDSDTGDFGNKIFISGQEKVIETAVKADDGALEKTLQVSLAKLENKEVSINFEVNAGLLATYNEAYYDNAILLPDSNYSFETNKAIITAGNISSNDIKIVFKNLPELDREKRYVLPVSISTTNFNVLESDRTKYFLFRGSDLINVVADIDSNFLTVNWSNPEVCDNLSELTMEALIRPRTLDKLISTVMGIESYFLIRIGDAGFPSNQIQIATTSGNFPDGDSNKGLPLNEWVHIALTYNAADGKIKVFVNGSVQSETTKMLGSLNLGSGNGNGQPFQIGRSYADDRSFDGEISEVRIWNKIRTNEEITNNPYFVLPDSEGLVSYWKFNDESPKTVVDQTGNGNNAIANSNLVWTSVRLPEPSN